MGGRGEDVEGNEETENGCLNWRQMHPMLLLKFNVKYDTIGQIFSVCCNERSSANTPCEAVS